MIQAWFLIFTLSSLNQASVHTLSIFSDVMPFLVHRNGKTFESPCVSVFSIFSRLTV